MLQRKIEVRNPGLKNGVYQLIGQVRGVEVQQADPWDPLSNLVDQRDDAAGSFTLIPAKGCEVLSDEDDLLDLELIYLSQDGGKLS